MAKNKKMGTNEKGEQEQQLEKGWAICEKCSVKLKEKNLPLHMEKVHGGPPVSKEAETNSFVPLLIVIVLVVGIIGAGIYYGFFSNNGSDNGNDIEVPDPDWLDSYSPKNRVSIYDDDWWVSIPQQNPSAGSTVSHPSWVTDRIKSKPLLVFAHSDNCMPCIEQQEFISEMMKVYGNDVQLLDLLSGNDARATEAFKAYDPNGSPNYIPLTAVITLAEDNTGTVRIVWHSIEGATGGEWLSNYVKDAIYYHHQYAARWSG